MGGFEMAAYGLACYIVGVWVGNWMTTPEYNVKDKEILDEKAEDE